jgi:hypothetical protein
MTFVDHLKGIKTDELLVEVAFGRHVIAGDLTKSIFDGTKVTVQHILGDAFGKGWSGPEGVWFRSINRDSTKYKFHPGIMSPGNSDTTQGIDTVFDQDTPHSNLAWIRCDLPSGTETGIPDTNIKDNPPTGLTGVYKTQLGDTYDNIGDLASTSVFLVNPADVIGFGCMKIRRYASSRIDWESLDALRIFSDVLVTPDYTTLPEGVGLTASYYDGSAFNTFKSKRWDPVIQYDISTGAPALDLTPTAFSVRFEGKIRFKYTETYTMYLTHNDSGKLWINNLASGSELINQSAAGTHSATFAATANQWYDIKLEWTNAASDSQFVLEWQSTTQPRQTVPQDRLYPKAEAIKRFETHIAVTQRTSFEGFLRSVLFTCNGSYQDIGGKLTFFSVDDTSSSFAFAESDIIQNSFKFYPRFSQQELFNLPNRFVAEGRDLNNRYLEKFDPPLYYDLPDLQNIAGRVIEETVTVGNTNRWQGILNLAYYAKVRTAPLVCEFEGMPHTLPVMQGDIVNVTKEDFGVYSDDYLVIEATDKSIDSQPDNKIFKAVLWGEQHTSPVIPPDTVPIAFISAGANAGGSSSTVTIDTTGANFLIAAVTYFNAATGLTLTDTKGNTWVPLTPRSTGGGAAGLVQFYYCLNPTVGAGHGFTWAGTSAFGSIAVAAYSHVKLASAFDAENGAANASVTTQQTGSVTPSENNELLVSGLLKFTFSTPTIDSGFTVRAYASGGGSNFDVAIADRIQTTAAAVNATWSSNSSAERMGAVLASFKHN